MLKKLINVLKETKLPVVYGSWKKGQKPTLPYLVVLEDDRDDFFADSTNFYNRYNYLVELVFENKNPEVEKKVELALSPFSFNASGDLKIEEEGIYEKIYYIELGDD